MLGADLFYGLMRHGGSDIFTVDADYRIRFLSTDEPFKAAGGNGLSFDHRARHYLSVDGTLAFTGYLGATVSFRDGSLPPLFQEVHRKVVIGLTLKLRQWTRTTF